MFSEKSLTEKEHKKHAELVDNIDTLVDDVLAKNKGSFSDAKIEKKCPSDEFLKHGVNKNQIKIIKNKLPVRKILAVVLTFILIFVIIPASLPYLYGDFNSDVSISLVPQNVHDGDLVFINVTIPASYRISSITADMGGIETVELSLIDNSTESQLWQAVWTVHDVKIGEYFATIKAIDVNNTQYSSIIDWSVLPPEDITNETGDIVHADVPIIGNESSNETTPPVNDDNGTTNTTVVSDLIIWDDTDYQKRYVNDAINFYANYSSYNQSIENAVCLISFNDGGWTEPAIMNYNDGLYQYSRSFVKIGIYEYIVSCSAVGYENRTLLSDCEISEHEGANGSTGGETGNNITFSKPQSPTDFSATTFDETRIDLLWTKGTGANNTYIVRKIDSYPNDRSDGTIVYNGTGTSSSDTELSQSTQYYYRAWSYAQWIYNSTTSSLWSDDYASATNTINYIPTITNPYPANGSTGIPLTPTLNITINDLDGDTMTLVWSSNSSGTWKQFGQNNSCVNGTYRWTNTNFSSPGIKYYWRVNVTDGLDTNYTIYSFTTDGTPPTSSVNAITPYWQKSSPLTITVTASDVGSGLKNVTLYYYNSTNNNTWKGPWKFGNTNTTPWITPIRWNFNFSNGTGCYRFYSVAYDNATNKETFTGNDTWCGYDKQFGMKPKEVQVLGDEPEDNTTPAYFFQGTNIPGAFIKKVPNFDYFWSLFLKHSMWQLEGWNPQTQQWISEWDGQNLNEWLTINRTRSNDSMDEKISLTVTNHAPIATRFRFTFGIDLRVKEFANRTGQYEYTLSYQANQTENYNMRFNWSDLIPLVQNGAISLNHGIKNVGGKDLFWFRITGNKNLGVNKSFTIDPTYGLIADAVTSSWEYNKDNGQYPAMIRLGTSEYYAIVNAGFGQDGWINTTKVWNNNGTIQTSCVDSLEYDTTEGIAPSICLVSGNIYAILYEDTTGAKETIVTVKMWDTNGTIDNGVIDTQQLTYNSVAATASRSKILNMGNNIFAVVYTQVTTTDLWLETWTIATDGTITNTVVNSVKIDGTDGIFPDMCKVDSDTVAVIYDAGAGGGNDGYLLTRNISAAGVIASTNASNWEFNTQLGATPTIAKVTGNIFMIAYKNKFSDLYVNTTTIDDNGMITKSFIDTQLIDATLGDFPTFFNVSYNAIANKWIKGITFSGEGSDGYVSTFDVDSAGAIGSEIDTLETMPADIVAWYTPACWVSGFYFLLISQDQPADGWMKTFQIYANLPPEISNPSPADGATGVSTTPQLSVNVSDIGDYLNATWSSNSSGNWHDFGWNRSLLSYGAIRDTVVNSWEYNKVNGRYPDMIRLGTSEYYAIVNSGQDSDGFINVTRVWNNNGTIQTSIVDSLEYDATDSIAPSICHVSGDVYAISFYDDTANFQTISTVNIDDADGQIGAAVIDTQTLTYDSIAASRSKILNMGNNIFAVVYTQVTTTDLWLQTWTIATDGTITNTVVDSVEIDGTDGIFPDMCKVDSDTVAVVYDAGVGGGNDGYLLTRNISAAGDIANTNASKWEFDTGTGKTPTIIKINGNTFAISYESTLFNYINTCTIADTGMITGSWIDTLTLSNPTIVSSYSVISSIGNNLYAITCQGSGGDGFIKTVKITDAGDIACFEYDSLEFDTADLLWYAPILPVANDYYLIVYEGTGNDGFAVTVKIGNDTTTTIRQTNSNFSAASTKYYWRVNVSDGVNANYSIYSFTTAAEVNNPPTQTGESPTNGSTGVALTPRCNITINDQDGDAMTLSWYENSTGSYVLRQTNSSCANGTYRWTDAQATAYNTNYYWKVYCNDGTVNVSSWYSFTTYAKWIVKEDTGPSGSSIKYPGQRKLARDSDGYLYCVYNRTYNGKSNIMCAKSTDGGENWTEYQVTTSSTTDHTGPSIAVDSYDHLHIVFNSTFNSGGTSGNGGITYARSTDGGVSWSTTKYLTPHDCTYSQRYPCIAIDSTDKLHVVWYGKYSASTNEYEIRYCNSTNGGTTWSSPSNVTTVAVAVNNYNPSIAIDSNDVVHAVWYADRGLAAGQWIRYSSDTGTGSWSADTTISDTGNSNDQTYPCIAVDGNDYLHVVWYGTPSGGSYTQIRYTRKATTWSAPYNISGGTGNQYNPSISVVAGSNYLKVVWYGEKFVGDSALELRLSNYTTSWSWPINLTFTLAYKQYYPNLIWAENPNATNRLAAGYAFIYANGTTIKYWESADLDWASLSCDVSPLAWDIGRPWIGGTNQTSGGNFTFTNNGDVAVNVQIKATDAVNSSTGFTWNLTQTQSNNNFSLQRKIVSDSWEYINETYAAFYNNLAALAYTKFDLKMLMASSSTKHNISMSLTITFRSVIA